MVLIEGVRHISFQYTQPFGCKFVIDQLLDGADKAIQHSNRLLPRQPQAAQGAFARDAVGLWKALAAAEGNQARQG